MNPSYWLLMEDRSDEVIVVKFRTIEQLNEYLTTINPEALVSYEVISGFSLRQEVFR